MGGWGKTWISMKDLSKHNNNKQKQVVTSLEKVLRRKILVARRRGLSSMLMTAIT